MNKSSLKIACVGNMNNNMFSLVRHLNNRGFNAFLILTNEYQHFQPEADSLTEIDYSRIRQFPLKADDFQYLNKVEGSKFFSEFDFFIACGIGIALLNICRIKINIVIPYGSDLYELPFANQLSKLSNAGTYSTLNRKKIAANQKRGIEKADLIMFDTTNNDFEKVFRKFRLKGRRIKQSIPFIYTPEFNPDSELLLDSRNDLTDDLLKFRSEGKIILFSHIRQSWENPEDEWSYKGNDRIIRAFRNFILSQSEPNCVLVLFEYGCDIEASKKLIAELNIQNYVYWSKLRPRKEILAAINYCDIGIGEIGNISWFSYGAIYEFIALRKPVIHYREDSLYLNQYAAMYPMYSAKTEEKILEHLNHFLKDKASFIKAGNDAYEWFNLEAIEKPLHSIINEINNFRPLSKSKKSASYLLLHCDRILKKTKLRIEKLFHLAIPSGLNEQKA